MAFSLIRSLVKFTIKYVGDGLTGGVIPVGSIATGIYDEWCRSETPAQKADGQTPAPPPAAQVQVRAELEKIVQDCRAYRQQVEAALAEMNPSEEVRQRSAAYLSQVPGRIQASLRCAEDPTGRTVPSSLVLRRADDLAQFLPDKMPRFKPGDRAVPGTDLVVAELLGTGGFGEVWKAVHKSRPHAPPVALKFCTQESAARSLRKEVELLDRVANQGRHKGIVELKYAHLEGDTPCLEYEYVDGGDLATLITDLHRAGRARPMHLTKIVYALSMAVGFAHRLKPPIVHRDLKPQNILTTRIDGKVHFKVADFGIGGIASDRAIQEWNSETKAGVRSVTESAGSCTPLYASPQQRRFGPPDPRDDVYALGVIWFQMLTGDTAKEPPRGGSWKRKLRDQGATREMVVLLERCLEDDPAERPADAHDLANELSTILRAPAEDGPPVEGEPVRAILAEPLSPPPPRQSTRPGRASFAESEEAPVSDVTRGKKTACAFIASLGLTFAVSPLLMLLEQYFLTESARESASPGFGFVCLLSLGGGAWFGATRLSRYSWRTIWIFAGICMAMLTVFSPFVATGRGPKTTASQVGPP